MSSTGAYKRGVVAGGKDKNPLPSIHSTTDGADDDGEEILPLNEQTNRPTDNNVQQQRIEGWHPILDPEYVIYAFLILAVIFIPTGIKMKEISDNIEEIKVIYDAYDESKINNIQPNGINSCTLQEGEYNLNKKCNITLQAEYDMYPPILIYYELTNFHQNHRSYYNSRDNYQLTGSLIQYDADAKNCEPLNFLGDVKLNPCGLVANTFFNDIFKLVDGYETIGGGVGSTNVRKEPLLMQEDGIAWQSDKVHRFKQPNGFQMKECPSIDDCKDDDEDSNTNTTTKSSCCLENNFSCIKPAISKKDGLCYAYDYPNDDTTQYLYETYPNIINPLEGITNEHFIVWMRTATLPTFRKLYGYIEQPIKAGTKFTFEITNNYNVKSFHGTKSIIVSTTSIFGGKNPYLGVTFYSVGFFCLSCGMLFAIKHWFRPRKLANIKYLNWNKDE